MATLTSLVDKVRVELGDLGKSFVTQFVADGTTNRFQLHYAPLDGAGVRVFANGAEVSNTASVEESTGILVLDTVPADGTEFLVSGTYYRYFTATEVGTLVTTALEQHTAHHTDSLGRTITIENLPTMEEYPVAVYAVSLALYTLATDASFDIDIQAPDGVSIPRSERYRQLMEMIDVRKQQYRELCMQLGIGMYKVDIFTLRRISKTTGRYVPVYRPQEVDDRSYPQRVKLEMPSYGDQSVPWVTEAGDLTAYQGRSFSTSIDFEGAYTGYSFLANLLNQRGSALVVQHITLTVTDHGPVTAGSSTHSYTATFSLTKDQTLRLAQRTYWSFSTVNDTTAEQIEIKGGNFITSPVSSVVL